MNKYILILVIFLVSCVRTEYDTDVSCTGNCTIFSGQIKTVDNVGVANVKLNLNYRSANELTSYTRKIGETTTDKNGYYNMSVYLNDNEIGEIALGYFKLTFNSTNLSTTLSDEYLTPDDIVENAEPTVYFYSVLNRNQTFENDFIVPKKGNIRIKLNNFVPVNADDFFIAKVLYNYNLFNNNWSFISPYNDGLHAVANKNQTVLDFVTVLDNPSYIVINKKKNAVFETVEQEITLKTNDVFEVEFDF